MTFTDALSAVFNGWLPLIVGLVAVVIYQQWQIHKFISARARCRLTHQLRPEFLSLYEEDDWPEVVGR